MRLEGGGTDARENVSDPSANTTMLKVSEGLSTLPRSPISFLPCPMESRASIQTRRPQRCIARWDLIRLHHLRRFGHQQEEVLILSLIEQQARGDLLASQPVAKNEVAVARPSLLVVERHLRAPRGRRTDRDLMRWRPELPERHAGRHHAGQVELALWRFALSRMEP